jgi:hypothetical protein
MPNKRFKEGTVAGIQVELNLGTKTAVLRRRSTEDGTRVAKATNEAKC